MATTKASATPLLQMRGIVKTFPGARALDGVDLVVRAGEVHCLLGQNGAGKSTLIKVLAGAHQPDEGEILVDGEPVTIAHPVAALEHGIATMYQELDVVDGLSVAENVFLGHEVTNAGFTRRREIARRTRALLERLGHGEIPPHREVGRLSAAGKQIVSMARALSRDARVIVMDEPSAVLDSGEVENLFRVVRQLTASGVAIVYISHRLDEIRQIGDRITVLKDGATVATDLAVGDTPTPALIELMTGRAVESTFPARPGVADDAPVLLSVRDLALAGVFSDVSFEVRAGEIVGLAGLVGAGRSEILETVYGARRATSGSVQVEGRRIAPGSVPAAVRAGLGLCPEERKSQGLVLDEPVYRNVTLPSFARFARAGMLDEAAERAAADEQEVALDVRPAGTGRAARTLSGGNQQKVLLGRWLVQGCRVLLLDEPTRGVDVGARAEIYALVRRLADAGDAVVVVSSEIEEVLGLADRVLVVSDGRVVHQGPADQIDEHGVLDLVMEGSVA
ncbi:monosaccharide ABC transporter ATP-binding protein (CUT2 family) [Sediminihabitans luteus]|uniref:Monosaccharide ABC transporter ATP-binding protein (CUT2 family) n=1 Tax=Sediminihabitans luteus TaxID=1138585 RepID=A0A2M9CE28_9CELL|nr:sugar ABC transporter ATP-binding protein [Sediminihabitans luteus]PJJ70110.1 monosaccharide ABC transporter ATP-binding protein (CUT2 family) [Sediminihabitans luteus]GIJ00106.1 sugar ABC transporter ATP-binding protein [Sediminihabitans luteus]